jgi:two-component system sensor histidine kinase and response regulator WspE
VISETGSNGAITAQQTNRYGLVVDQFLGERNLVVRPLDHRLGKVPNISAAALMEDGSPVLIVDTEDLVRSIDKLLASGQLSQVNQSTNGHATKTHKRILVVDDSITVREMERKLLQNKGYDVEVAVNGMDGWNAVRSGHYDLVITDIDMPRMNGIELVNQIKTNTNLKSLPVIIVSYKDREEDRIHGLEAGANYYLTKSSFHDDSLVEAVIDLIGEA